MHCICKLLHASQQPCPAFVSKPQLLGCKAAGLKGLECLQAGGGRAAAGKPKRLMSFPHVMHAPQHCVLSAEGLGSVVMRGASVAANAPPIAAQVAVGS